MLKDKTILADGFELDGGEGIYRPNNNVIGVGISGGGKSLSLAYSNMLHTEESSVIATFGKKI